MRFEIILMAAGVLIAILGLLSSKVLRALCMEAFFHPRNPCEMQIHGKSVSITRAEVEKKLED